MNTVLQKINLTGMKKITMTLKTAYYLGLIFPIIAAQIFQRLFPIIDNRYVSALGDQALYIHNIQYNFIILGQFIGTATTFSCLTFWNRIECLHQQGNILIKHLGIAILLTIVLALFAYTNSKYIFSLYHINASYLEVFNKYLAIGLINMILQVTYLSLDGILIASRKTRLSMIIAMILTFGNILLDSYIINYLNSAKYPFEQKLMYIGTTTAILLLIAIIISLTIILRHVKGWSTFSLKQLLTVWPSEIGIYLIRGITPFIYTYQLAQITSTAGLLVTYQLASQLSYVLCLPLIASMQVAIREVSAISNNSSSTNTLDWKQFVLRAGIIPCTFLLAIGILTPIPTIHTIFGHQPTSNQAAFLTIFFIACMIGQIGNVLTIPLRAKKLTYFVTRNFFISEFIVLIGGTQLLIIMGQATPLTIGLATLAFTAVYCILNLQTCRAHRYI